MTDYVVVDLETTGFSPETNDILEIGAWKVRNGVVTDKFCTLVRPIMYIPRTVQELTGITYEDVKDCEQIEPILIEFFDWCEDLPFLVHNLEFDYRFLVTKGKVLGLDFTLNDKRCGIDTMKLCKQCYTFESNKLENVVKELNIEVQNLQGSFHRAKFDSYMTKLVYDRLLAGFGKLATVSTPEILDKDFGKYGKPNNQDTLSFV